MNMAEAEMIELGLAVEEHWKKLSETAAMHHGESAQFHKICEKYYGVTWSSLPQLTDNDRIIDTIDYGTDVLSFAEFDKLVRSALAELRDTEEE